MDTTGRIGEKARKKTKGKPYLPNDIIPNILCRLPAKKARQSRLVCKTWRDSTLNRDFVDLHFRHSLPMILVSKPRPKNKTADCFLLDKWWELPARTKLLIHKFQVDYSNIPYNFRALFSHGGLAVFDDYDCDTRRFIIGNPMDPENLIIIAFSKQTRWSDIYGVFFHPSRKQYCSLWMIQESNEFLSSWSDSKWIKYKILTLDSNPSLKTITNPFSHRVKRPSSTPIFIDKYLYWMLEPEDDDKYRCRYMYSGRSDIMQFDIISEEFKFMPCPIPQETELYYKNINKALLNIDGILSFVLVLPREITIWRLEDHAQQLWTTANYTFTVELYQGSEVPRAIAVVDGKLALLAKGRLIVGNLMQGTMYCRKTQYDFVSYLSHQMNLAYLANCTSKIYIDQDGEVR